jgi:hypothetical protein
MGTVVQACNPRYLGVEYPELNIFIVWRQLRKNIYETPTQPMAGSSGMHLSCKLCGET